jgi:hypothetical protein
LNEQRLVSVLQRAGFRGSALKTAFGIAMRESGGRDDAYNGNTGTGDQSYGLFQINMLGQMGPARRQQFGLARNEDLFDPVRNAKAAFRMSNGGRDFGAWGIGPNAYRSGAGYDTIAEHVARFPGKGRLPHVAEKAQAVSVPDFDVEQILSDAKPDGLIPSFDVSSVLQPRRRKPDVLDEIGLDPLPEFAAPPRTRQARISTRATEQPAVSGPGIQLPASFRKTHDTSNLGWPAVDIMGAPGTPVRSPRAGTIVDHGSAQGGESLTLDVNNDGKGDYWLGHIFKSRPVGARVRRGEPLALISPDHPRPHAHWAKR